jgi:hypothetical protein
VELVIWSFLEAGWFVAQDGTMTEECIDTATQALQLAAGDRSLSPDEKALGKLLDAFYASELNSRVGQKDGWIGQIGDVHNGFKETSERGLSLPALLDWLPSAACRAHPESDYAKRFRSK